MVKTDKEVNKAVEKKISNYRKKLSNKEMSEIINTTLSNGVFVADKYAFSLNDVKQEFKRNHQFKDIISSGAYFYFQNKLCICLNNTIVVNNDGVYYSEDVKKNPSLYFLTRINRGHLHRKPRNNTCEIKVRTYFIHAKQYQELSRKGRVVIDSTSYLMNEVGGYVNGTGGLGPGDSFGLYFTWLMDEKYNISKKELADITGIDERTITRMRTKEDYLPSLEFIIACCIAMSLLPWESDKLIDLAGYKLRTNLKIERGYIALIHVFYQCSIDECNEFREQMGLTSLSSIIKTKKKNKQ